MMDSERLGLLPVGTTIRLPDNGSELSMGLIVRALRIHTGIMSIPPYLV